MLVDGHEASEFFGPVLIKDYLRWLQVLGVHASTFDHHEALSIRHNVVRTIPGIGDKYGPSKSTVGVVA